MNKKYLNPREAFLALDAAGRRAVHLQLCQLALQVWQDYAAAAPLEYVETVAGTRQVVDPQLPADALAAARQGADDCRAAQRYLEPIVALQDEDLVLPDPARFAYYAIYNLFQKYALRQAVDDWLIVNQALAAHAEETAWAGLLARAVQAAA